MTKVIYDHTKNIKRLHKFSSLLTVKCKFVLEVLLFHILPAWEKHPIVNINIQGLPL